MNLALIPLFLASLQSSLKDRNVFSSIATSTPQGLQSNLETHAHGPCKHYLRSPPKSSCESAALENCPSGCADDLSSQTRLLGRTKSGP
eukprot:635308-Amphidinium_carterae.1